MSVAELGPYPNLAKCGVKWIESAPAHWRSVPMKYLALGRGSLFLDGDWIESKDLADSGIRYITTGNVGPGMYKEQGTGFITEKKFHELGCTEVFPGDMLVSRLNRPIGRACIVPELGFRIVTSVDNVIVRAEPSYLRAYLVYLCSSPDYLKHTGDLARGATMQRISRGQLGNIRLVVPPLEEQTQIAKFLDYETARIDALIEKQEQLIALLKEKRQAVISHAVTKGLNPDAPMRDSGVEWLGEVPAHWEVKRLRHILAEPLKNGISPQAPEHLGIATFSIAAVRSGRVDIMGALKVADISEKDAAPYWVHRGDVMMMRGNGSRDLVGSVGLVTEVPKGGCIYPDILIRLRFGAQMDARFAVPFLNSRNSRPQIEMGAKTAAGIWKVSGATVSEFVVPVPPTDEQAEILKVLDARLGALDRLTEGVEAQMEVLHERRTALISAAVTGKIDVRNWKPPASTSTDTTTSEVA